MLIGSHTLSTDTGSEQVYNALDCCMTHEIFTSLSKQTAQAHPAYGFELALQAPVLEMMLRGFRVDPGARDLAIRKTRTDLLRLEYVIDQLAAAVWDRQFKFTSADGTAKIASLNPNSGHQLKELFYGRLAIPQISVFDKGELKFPMDRSVIERVDDYFQARPISSAVLEYRDLSKQLEVLEKEVDADWRMRTSYNIGGTKSARFSSSKSPTGTGGNFQNVRESLRHIFIADPGNILVGIDAEQSDSRMVGYMLGLLFDDWTYLDACESGDLHTYVARLTWPDLRWTGDIKKDRAIAELPFYRHFSYRDSCKKLGHGTNFLGKPPTLSKLIHIPQGLVTAFQERYFTAFPAIPQWHAWTANQLQTHKRLTTIHGRTRDFFDRTNSDETLRQALAFLAAAATADNLNLGMWRVWRHMPEVQLLAQVHDAIYFQFPETLDVKRVVRTAVGHLSVPLTAPNGRVFTVPAEAKSGYNWGNYIPGNDAEGKAEINPKGLRKMKVV